MDIIDIGSLPDNLALDADICIVGSGPAGLAIASELAGSNARVVILESGGLREDEAADALNEFESVGQPRVATGWKTCNRIFGGTSHTWSGRCAEFDDIDYAHRDWVPHSGWDLGRADLAPFIRRAARHLGLESGASGPARPALPQGAGVRSQAGIPHHLGVQPGGQPSARLHPLRPPLPQPPCRRRNAHPAQRHRHADRRQPGRHAGGGGGG